MDNTFKVFFYCLVGFAFGALNNAIYKLLSRIPSTEIISARFFFATIFILPIVIKTCKSIKTNKLKLHFARGLAELIAILSYVIGFKKVPLSNGTFIIFIIPFWAILFSKILINEKIEKHKIILTSLIFMIILNTFGIDKIAFNSGLMILLIGTIFSGFYDVLNKKCSMTENPLISLLYFNLIIFVTSFIFSMSTFILPTKYELFLCIALGIGSNILNMCLLKAFSLSNASFVSTFRYLEFIYSVILGIILFNEKPNINIYIASIAVILIQTIITIYEKNYNCSQQKSNV